MGKIRRLAAREAEKWETLWENEPNPELEASWKDELEKGRRLVYVYEEAGQVLGEGALVLEDNPNGQAPDRAYVSHMIVQKEYRSRGIGGALLDVMFREAESLGRKTLPVAVEAENEEAVRLYIRKGFDRQVTTYQDSSGRSYVRLAASLEEESEQEPGQGYFTCYFMSRMMLIAAGVFLLGAMALGPMRYTELSVAFGGASAVLSLCGMGLGFASWNEEE